MGGSSPSNPGLNFGQSEGGLFSREEIRVLMATEFRRSQRYDYPLTLFLVEVDRLESLHDLYGVESKARIVRSVTSLLRSATRASDVLGCLHDDRLLVLFPHATRVAASFVAKRLLAGCRELEFRGDGRSLRATLSIGSIQRSSEADFPVLLGAAEAALAAAVRSGGDRLVEHESLARREAPPPTARVPAPGVRSERARPSPPEPVLPELEELGGSTLEEKVANLFRMLGAGAPDGDGLAQEVLDTIHLTLSELRGERISQADVAREIQVLERRIERLKELLGASEEELARMVREKSVDPGLASVYRSVQGLDPLAHDFARKKALLAVIYQANVELLEGLRARPE